MNNNLTLKTPKVSVIMPFYNCEKFLDESISSILDQTFKDFELILINDCSTDNSNLIVEKYLSDERIVYISSNEKKGKVFNLNLGIETARADLIAVMDGDDVSEVNRLENEYVFLLNNPDIAVVGGFVQIINENGEIIDKRTKLTDPQEIKKKLLFYGPLVHPSVMYRKEIVKKVGLYREKYTKVAEDQDLWYRIVYSNYNISNIPKFLLKYRYHNNSTAHNGVENSKIDYNLKKETIRDFNLKPSIEELFMIYTQLIVGTLTTGRQRQWIEGLYKKILYGNK